MKHSCLKWWRVGYSSFVLTGAELLPAEVPFSYPLVRSSNAACGRFFAALFQALWRGLCTNAGRIDRFRSFLRSVSAILQATVLYGFSGCSKNDQLELSLAGGGLAVVAQNL
ncbi:hypothetical protein [Phytopseudomonas flavescens]|uniref:hypothetical protein n=1 Tax=Phytopseudomonas flavescens TaxID=29435 RepID=UPI00111360E4|nr:hypothetical protein [Pseudomonas flavescens]